MLNCGNVVFTVPRGKSGDAAPRIEKAIKERLGVSTRVTGLTGREVASAVPNNPLATVALDPSRQPMSPSLLATAAIPALLGSLWILEYGSAPRALLAQQTAIAALALLATLVSVRSLRPRQTSPPSQLLMLTMAAVLLVPVLSQASSAPHRWLDIPGFRLYVAPVVLPLFLLLWQRALVNKAGAPRASSFSAALAGAALFAQPDAAQLTALAVGAVPLVWCSAFFRRLRLPVVAGSLLAAAVSWSLPDPLAPVPYVEGVFLLAASFSYWALAVFVVAAALPVAVIAWSAYSMKSAGLLAVALYFGALLLLAPTQATPVPLLGFGAGPILGYFLMASQAWHLSASASSVGQECSQTRHAADSGGCHDGRRCV